MKHTKGKVYIRTQEDAHYVHLEDIINTRAISRIYFRDGEYKSEEDKANAELITEAFNVTNECGLTPRELLAQRDELLDALIIAHGELGNSSNEISSIDYKRIENAINNVKK